MRKKDFVICTLASNKKSVAIALNNIAFALLMEETNDKGELVKFTRVYLKEIVIDDDAKWVDICEPPKWFEKI